MGAVVLIDPEILAARAELTKAAPNFDLTKLPTAEARRQANDLASLLNDGRPELERVEDFVIFGPGGDIRLRMYQPPAPRCRGTILYIHGGGWFACNVDTHDRMLRTLAREGAATVIGVDYRLSPEHVYPAALQDCRAAWDWLVTDCSELAIDPRRVAIAGDSAGANLALALTIQLRDEGRRMPISGVLLYGCFAPGLDTPSMRRFGAGGYGLTTERMAWYWNNYLGSARASPPLLATPLHADLRGLPPQFLGISEADIVADDSRLLRDRLEQAGVDVTLVVWPGAVHGFLQMTRDVALAREAVRDIAAALAGHMN